MTIAGERRTLEIGRRFMGWQSVRREERLAFRVEADPRIPRNRFGGDSSGAIDATPRDRADSPTRSGAIKRLFFR